jgi:hypothetical protein
VPCLDLVARDKRGAGKVKCREPAQKPRGVSSCNSLILRDRNSRIGSAQNQMILGGYPPIPTHSLRRKADAPRSPTTGLRARVVQKVDPEVDKVSLDTANTWRFKPATAPDGTPVPVRIVFQINFVLYR